MSDKLLIPLEAKLNGIVIDVFDASGECVADFDKMEIANEAVKRCNAYPKLLSLTKGFRDACKQNPTNNNEAVAELIETLLTELNETGD